jgi:hypothetical protein
LGVGYPEMSGTFRRSDMIWSPRNPVLTFFASRTANSSASSPEKSAMDFLAIYVGCFQLAYLSQQYDRRRSFVPLSACIHGKFDKFASYRDQGSSQRTTRNV